MTRVGVIVPCRDEAAVVARKLRNLALCRWPQQDAPHELVVVDDGSGDATADLARVELARFDASVVRARVVRNDVREGKGGAIEAGLRALGSSIDLIVLTDADVVVAPDAIEAFARAFEADASLAMASGAQSFVTALPDDGTLGPGVSDDHFYDRCGTWVRALESRFGLLFSVQGQWMAWRRALELVPTPGIAADDLDLMLQVRVRGGAIRRIADARFLEVRAPRGPERERQTLRRTRAFVQFLRHPRIRELRNAGSWLARQQASSYLRAARPGPGWSVVPLVLTAAAGMAWGPYAALAAIVVVTLIGAPFWILLRRVRSRIEAAQFVEARHGISDRWETARR